MYQRNGDLWKMNYVLALSPLCVAERGRGESGDDGIETPGTIA